MTDNRQPVEALATFSNRWLIGITVGICLQLLTGWWAVRTIDATSDLLAQLMNFLILVGLMMTAGAVLALSTWRDSHFVDAHTDWSPNGFLWVVAAVCVPVIAPSIYLGIRYASNN